MAKPTPIGEHFQYFLGEMKERLWAISTGRRSQPGGSLACHAVLHGLAPRKP